MPQKKRGGDAGTANSRDESTASAAPKRQRVSLACDACRTARERCDGNRPVCGTCVTQSRPCSYTPTAKKRGVPTGYLRTIELSLAWLLYEQAPGSEDALFRLLSTEGGVLQKKGKAADRLHKKWTKSRINKEIGRVLSGTPSQAKNDTSGEDSETDYDGDLASVTDSNDAPLFGHSPIVPRPRSDLNSPSVPTLKLPSDWRRLVDIYFAYTHCWLPILDRQRVLEAAAGYPSEGIPASAGQNHVPPSCAELWAVFSLAAFQDASSQGTSDGQMTPKRMYAVARSLIPSEESQFELPHLRSLLLHALVLMGQGAELAAWMLVGTATRLALHLRGTGALYVDSGRQDELSSRSGSLTLAACFILDTLTSATLGHSTSLQIDLSDILSIVSSYVDFAENERWQPVTGFHHTEPQPVATQPIRVLRQMLKFSQILSSHLNQGQANNVPNTVAQELGHSLDPNYAFCNSVILGGNTPAVPSAFLLQVFFMSTTIRLMQGYRASIMSSLMEIAESCISLFGTCGTPPVVVTLLGTVQRCGYIDKMHQSEQSKWFAMTESLKQIWACDDAARNPRERETPQAYLAEAANTQSDMPSLNDFSYGINQVQHGYLPRRSHTSMGGQFQAHAASGLAFTLPQAQAQTQGPSGTQHFAMGPPVKSPSSGRNMSLASPNIQSSGRGVGSSMFNPSGGDMMDQTIDYDAILEELGSIDANDGLDMDPQFMTNLGFAPGCDLGEMFQGDFGV